MYQNTIDPSTLSAPGADPRYNVHSNTGCYHCWENYPHGCGRGDCPSLDRATALRPGYDHQTPGHQPRHPPNLSPLSIPSLQGGIGMNGPLSFPYTPTPSTASVRTPTSGVDEYYNYGMVGTPGYLGIISPGGDPNVDPSQLQDTNSPIGFRRQVGGSRAAAKAAMSLRRKPAAYFCKVSGCNSEGFTEKHNFNNHMNAHYGRKDFICLKCSKAFGTKSDLERHKKRATPCSPTSPAN